MKKNVIEPVCRRRFTMFGKYVKCPTDIVPTRWNAWPKPSPSRRPTSITHITGL